MINHATRHCTAICINDGKRASGQPEVVTVYHRSICPQRHWFARAKCICKNQLIGLLMLQPLACNKERVFNMTKHQKVLSQLVRNWCPNVLMEAGTFNQVRHRFLSSLAESAQRCVDPPCSCHTIIGEATTYNH